MFRRIIMTVVVVCAIAVALTGFIQYAQAFGVVAQSFRMLIASNIDHGRLQKQSVYVYANRVYCNVLKRQKSFYRLRQHLLFTIVVAQFLTSISRQRSIYSRKAFYFNLLTFSPPKRRGFPASDTLKGRDPYATSRVLTYCFTERSDSTVSPLWRQLRQMILQSSLPKLSNSRRPLITSLRARLCSCCSPIR